MTNGESTKKPYVLGNYELVKKFAQTKQYSNASELARLLHEAEPTRSMQGWRSMIIRWVAKGNQLTFYKHSSKHNPVAESVLKITQHYDADKDVYVTYLPSLAQMISVSGSIHRDMKKSYSASGNNLTIENMSRKYNYPENWLVEYIKVYNWTHGMDIFTDDVIENNSEEILVNDLIAIKRNAVLEKANEKHWKDIEKDANKYRLFEETILNEFKDNLKTSNLVPKKPKLIKMKDSKPYSVVISPTDLHYGSDSWIDETGTHYNTQEAKKRLFDRTSNLISRLPSRPEKIFLATGSDWFHIDNEEGSTTGGTPQDMSASPARIFIDGCFLAREHIELLRTVCPIEVVFMRGNHDRHTALALMLYLSAVYEDVDDVNVILDPKLRQYISWGNNLIGFTHGDGVKGNDLPLLMASESRKNWGSCEHRIWFHGHLHHQRLLETGGTTVIQLPSLAGTDRWHYKKGFVLARPGISAHLLDKELGLIGNLFAPVINNE
tara:strand:- start:7776 stop:9254 length:1479 start_codon:yes stop_codon:yes gene_type:complete